MPDKLLPYYYVYIIIKNNIDKAQKWLIILYNTILLI